MNSDPSVHPTSDAPLRSASSLDSPAVIIDCYELAEKVGEGGMGVVWQARDVRLQRDVAVKLLRPGVAADSLAAQRFVAEAQLTGQLQHPGIPPVHELGTLPDGRPFLAMKLVKGRTLADLLKERFSPSPPSPLPKGEGTEEAAHPSQGERRAGASDRDPSRDRQGAGTDRGRFIAIFEQICHAVGYAHAHNVIHRDLKPGNVMVGTHGEVQVMDWGLAKVLTAPTSPAREGGGADPVATVDWHTAIDSPAQAGSATRTGSVLGTPAYMPPEQAGGEIRKLDARSDVFGLGAILCQILTGQPPYRGADGNEVRLQAVRWEMADAFARLDASGTEPELIALCKRCLAREQADRPADGNAVAQEVAAIRQAAEERARQAEIAKAQAQTQAAEQAKRRRLATILGGAIVAVLLVGLSLSLWQMQRAIDAEADATANAQQAEHNAAQARAERNEKEKERQRAEAALAAESKARAAERQARDQAMAALRVMTDELVERQLARAPTLTPENKDFLRKVIQQFEGFAKITADDAESRAIRAEGYFRVGLMRRRLGDLADAEAALRQALKLQEQLAGDFPKQRFYRRAVAASHNNLGLLLHDTGRLKEAEESYRQALKLQEQLAAEFPSRPDYRRELATSHNNLGNLLGDTGRLKEAEESYRQALKLQEQLVAEFPSRPEYREELAHGHNSLSILLRDNGRLKEAEALCRDALALQKKLVTDFPTHPEYRQDLAGYYNNLGLLLRNTRQLTEAETAWRQALRLRQQLVAEFPARPDFRQSLAESYNNLGLLLRDTGRLNEAEVAWRDALTLRKQLALEFPDRPNFRQALADGYLNLASVLVAPSRAKEAEEVYGNALSIYKQLAAEFPDRPDFRQDLANCYNNLGIVHVVTGHPKQAETVWREALKLRQQLAAEFPNQPDRRNDLATTLWCLAKLCNQRRDFAAAKEYLEKARPHHQAALKANPRYPVYRQFYHNHLVALVQAQAGLLDPAAAVQTAQTLRDLGWHPPADAYNATCALSLCIPLVEKHEKLAADKRKAAAQFYGDEAMKLLRDAVAKGWKNAAHMKKDRDLDPLRGREDFQKLLKELEAKSAAPADADR